MDVLHITTGISHSSAPLRLMNALDKVGVSSKALVLNKSVNDNRICVYKKSLLNILINKVLTKKEYKVLSNYNREKLPFSFGRSGVKLKNNKLVKSADILHFHWINGQYLSYKSIKQLVSLGKPVVWTFHDSWPMTGGCHVRYGCDRFIDGCGKCHELNSEDANDITSEIIKNKKDSYSCEKIVTVAPSKWMQGNISRSYLFRNSKNYQIYNPLDVNLYRKKEEFVEFKDKSVIKLIFGSSGTLDSKYKGYVYFVDAMKMVKEKYPELSAKLLIQIFGTKETNFPELDGFKIEPLGYIDSDQDMAKAYRNADIYVFPSLDDNLPGTVMECLASGTPVICFNTCGVPEMVQHKENGYVAEFRNAEDMAAGINWVYENNEGNVLGRNGRDYITKNFSQVDKAEEYKKIYEGLIKGTI